MAQAGSLAAAITHRERVIFPDAGLTKGDLADYYAALAGPLLGFARDRPLSIVRCPDGIAGQCFFQKHGGAGFGSELKSVSIREKDGESQEYMALDSPEGVLAAVQMGTVEFHIWGSRSGSLDMPDRLVFDLDPGEGIAFSDLRRAAREIRKRLEDLGLESFPLLTGGKGIHVVVPLEPGHSWDAHAAFAKAIALELAESDADRFTATMRKDQRQGRIFIDWLRNQRGATAIAPYSVRARPGAPVAAPVSWEELGRLDAANVFTVRDAKELLRPATGKALSGWGEARQRLPVGRTG
jgi:bifunctional non-homologous end joining protein LigD